MRGILNKLTPDNFERLVTQVKELNIENFHTFDAVIGLIFEKVCMYCTFALRIFEIFKLILDRD